MCMIISPLIIAGSMKEKLDNHLPHPLTLPLGCGQENQQCSGNYISNASLAKLEIICLPTRWFLVSRDWHRFTLAK